MMPISAAARAKISKIGFRVVVYLIVICLSYIILYPFIIKIFGSLRGVEDINDYAVQLIPKHYSLVNFTSAMTAMKFPAAFTNSLLLSLLVSLLQVFSAAMTGYGLARFRFLGRSALYALVLIVLMIPVQTTMTAMFLQFRYFDFFGLFNLILGHPLNLIDTVVPFALLSVTGFGLKNGLYIYLSMQTFRDLPKELDEASEVDGAGAIKTFWTVMLPNALPVLITVFLFSFCWQWTDSYYPSLFINKWDLLPRNIMFVVSSIVNVESMQISAATNAGMLLMILPLVLLYVVLQRFFIQGITKSGIVG
ncbi:MAG: carbohydrate ABC transporter permease [Oscillospiraceae bacterium]|jgi:multiple sugar transport system permease protein|nr:carbohydrate ABC transporter permease [Oscillospiraceae bacterium]